MKQPGQAWTTSADDAGGSAPMSRARAGCEAAGSLLIFLSAVAMVALLPAWLEIGAWTEVLTWFAATEAAVFLLGMALFWFGGRKPRA